MPTAEEDFRSLGGHATSLNIGRTKFALMALFQKKQTMVSALASIWRGPYATVGWGWDQQFPLRPWPVFWSDVRHYGLLYVSVTWCGFFVGVALPRWSEGVRNSQNSGK
jgi:hypothetical protein